MDAIFVQNTKYVIYTIIMIDYMNFLKGRECFVIPKNISECWLYVDGYDKAGRFSNVKTLLINQN